MHADKTHLPGRMKPVAGSNDSLVLKLDLLAQVFESRSLRARRQFQLQLQALQLLLDAFDTRVVLCDSPVHKVKGVSRHQPHL